jgi:hypothetical protein
MSNNSLEQLRQLIKRAKLGALPIKDFCEQFERIYNLELDKNTVPAVELKLLSALFDKVVWFSPHADERKKIPNYLGEAEIKKALDELSISS